RDFHVTGVQTCALPIYFGLSYQHRVGSPGLGQTEHYPTAGFDAMVNETFDTGGLRLWLDVLAGESFYEVAGKTSPGDPLFATAQIGRASCRGRGWSGGG